MTAPILTKQGMASMLVNIDAQEDVAATIDPVAIKNESVSSFLFFINHFLKHHFTIPFCAFHDELITTLSDEDANKRIVRIAPRGHGKTTLCAMAYPLWCLAGQHRKHILIIGSNQQLADLKLNDLINELEINPLLLSTFLHLKPKKDNKNQYVKYTDSHIVFEDGSDIMAKGMGAAVRGIKPRRDLIIIDDPEKDSDLDSPTTRGKNKRYFDSVVRFLGGPNQSLDILAIDTLKHFDSLIQYIFEKPGWDAKKYSAVVDNEKKQVLWPEVYCYDVDCLDKDAKKNWNRRGQDEHKITEPFYGRYFNKADKVEIIGIAEGQSESFAQEFLSQPVQLSAMPLRSELWKGFIYTDEVVGKMEYRLGALDLSMGKNMGDYQAIAAVGELQKNYYLLDAALSKIDLVKSTKNEESLAGLCVSFIKRYRLSLFVIEDNGSQGLFINSIARLIDAENIPCRLRTITSKHDKIERISTVLGLIMQRGSFYIRQDWREVYPQFMRQFEHFPKGDHDDAPDVTNMAIMGIQKMRR
jgi:predicted phage terminase large subunit-like protein